jgi:hypothetical protein
MQVFNMVPHLLHPHDKEHLILTGEETGWDTEPFWMQKKNVPALFRN